MKRKFIISLTFILSILFCFNVGCTGSSSQSSVTPPFSITLPTIKYEVVDGKTTSDEITSTVCSFPLDFSGIVFDDEPTFNKNLAKMALLTIVQNDLSIDVNFIDDAGNKLTDKTTYSQYGLQNETVVSMTDLDYAVDKNDLSGAMLGNILYEKGRTTYQLFFVTIMPYLDSSLLGWSSNFDVGADTDSYYSLTGLHPDWLYKKNHKGFDVSANRLYGKITDYISTYSNDSASPIVFLSGHSRGGAIASLISKRMTDENIKNLAYCFNSPNTTTEPSSVTEKYTNIINILNKDDIISLVPPSGCENFTRFGKTVEYKMSDNAQAWSNCYKVPYAFMSDVNVQTFSEKLLFIATNLRESIYEFDLRENVIIKQTKTFLSESDADKFVDKLLNTFNSNGIFTDCLNISKTKNGLFYVTYSIRPCLLIFIIQDVLTTGFDNALQVISDVMNYFDYIDSYINLTTIASMVSEIDGITRAHLEITGLIGIDYIQ